MITSCLALLLTVSAPAPTPQRYAEAVEVYHCGFEVDADINYDAWPDYWLRKTGPGYPQYLPVGIQPADQTRRPGSDDSNRPSPINAAEGKKYLRVALDGGAASLSSPAFPMSPKFSYVLEARLRTKGLKGHAATISLSFVDGQGRTLERFTSPPYRDFPEWTHVVLGPVEPHDPSIEQVVIGLHLEPGLESDLFGEVLVDDVWLGRLPRMSLQSNSKHNIFLSDDPIEIECRVSGIRDQEPQVKFELFDVFGEKLAAIEQKLIGDAPPRTNLLETEVVTTEELAKVDPAGSFSGSGLWEPPIKENGYYQVRVTMSGNTGVVHRRTMSLAVVEPMRSPSQGEFGWSLPQGENPLPFGPLAEVLETVGVNWIKYPVWRSEDETEWGNQFARFAEEMATSNIRIVGLLDQPPPASRHLFGQSDQPRLHAANAFHEAELWKPLIDPVMTRLALNVRWWQIGGDNDTSFVGYTRLTEKLVEIKQHLERFGQEVSIGISWRWLAAPPQSQSDQSAPWAFVSNTQALDAHTLQRHPAFTGEELLQQLGNAPQIQGRRWIVLEPLSREHYSQQTRALDLVQRMLAAKIAEADAVFIPNPFDPNHGLMGADGSPSELLLPWRTTSLTLAGTEYAGNIQLPKGSENRVFIAEDQAVMVLWSDTPRTETLYLGENVKQIDLWGRVTIPETTIDDLGRKQQTIEVSRLPIFLTGVQPEIARWRIGFQFTQRALPSVFGRQLSVGYQFENTFTQGVGGQIHIRTPEAWDVERNNIGFKLAPGEKRADAFQALFGFDASSGPTPIRVDFEVTGDLAYAFSAYRSQQVGLGEVEINLSSHIDKQGNLIVDQVFTNHTLEFVSFNCILFAPGRRRDRQPLIDLHQGKRKSQFVLPQGEELLGKTMYLRAEEINGDRVLSYRFEPTR